MPPRADPKGSSAHLVLNPAAGSMAAFRRRLTGAACERGIRVRVLEAREDARLAASQQWRTAWSRSRWPAVTMERELPLAIVPLGALNHFARGLGLNFLHPLRALDAFYAGHEWRVNVGRMNGRPFYLGWSTLRLRASRDAVGVEQELRRAVVSEVC